MPKPITDSGSYCDAAGEYYDRLGEAQSDLGLFPDDDELDDAFVELAEGSQELGEELRATAPDSIGDDVDVIVDAFELVQCGIIRLDF